MTGILKRKVHRNIWVIRLSFFIQKIRRHFNPKKGYHIDKIEKILSARILFNIDFFFETGTYIGVTTNYLQNYFSKMYSIELSKELAAEAQHYFRNKKHISIVQGDSGLLLENIIKNDTTKKLFWLDAHYSEGVTASSATFGETPISKEIEEILKYWIVGSVILIDDARCFTGTHNYPTIPDITKFVLSKNLGLRVFVDKDIIHIL
jgi:hypothetical protein